MTSRDNEKRERQIGEDRPEESKGDFPKEVNKIMRRIKCGYSRKKEKIVHLATLLSPLS